MDPEKDAAYQKPSDGTLGQHSKSVIDEDTKVYWEVQDKTSLGLELDDQQGTLFKIMEVFKQYSVNTTSISSKPK